MTINEFVSPELCAYLIKNKKFQIFVSCNKYILQLGKLLWGKKRVPLLISVALGISFSSHYFSLLVSLFFTSSITEYGTMNPFPMAVCKGIVYVVRE